MNALRPRRAVRVTRKLQGGRALYRRGAEFERRLKQDLERRGYFVLRSAGSHSPVDLIALRQGHVPLLVQAKRDGKATPADRDALEAVAVLTGGLGLLALGQAQGWSYTVLDTGLEWSA